MILTPGQGAPTKVRRAEPRPANASRALEWLWQHFQGTRRPQVLDCGPICQPTVNVLLRRGAKLYVADLITPARRRDQQFWDLARKQPVFRVENFLAQLPKIPPASLSAVFCWHLLDMLPRDSLSAVVERLCSYLQPGGALFFLLREPGLAAGVETSWWLESLMVLGSSGQGKKPFPYPPLTNREVERLASTSTAKTFLTRSGRREVLVMT